MVHPVETVEKLLWSFSTTDFDLLRARPVRFSGQPAHLQAEVYFFRRTRRQKKFYNVYIKEDKVQ